MRQLFKFIYAQNLFVMVLCATILILLWTFFAIKNKHFKIINFFICVLVLFSILYITIFARNNFVTEVILSPLQFLKEAQIQPELYRSFFMNIMLFIPLGITMPYLLSKNPYKRNILLTIVFSTALSAGIEFLQYYYHLGRCETDDVIANTLGASIGTLSYCIYIRNTYNKQKEDLMQNNINDNQNLLLSLCAKCLFDKDINIPDDFDIRELIDEANRQTVFSLIYSCIKDKAEPCNNKLFSQIIAKNIRIEYAHNEVHRIFTDNNIPYVVLKGVSSSSYYPEPMLRTMGDVDVLVRPQDLVKAGDLLNSIGFIATECSDSDDLHINYSRKDGIVCELHRRILGIPLNEKKEIINNYLIDIFDKSSDHNMSNGSCVLPSDLHHAIVILLHTATHMTATGVGLRHLCDWAVFVNDFSNDEFIQIFEKPLKDMGLWRFAQLLTLCCVEFLGCDSKEWAGECEHDLLESIVIDILNGGNFGTKDLNRQNQIKYISDRRNRSLGKNNPLLQLISSVNSKTLNEFEFVTKYKILLPIGWLFTIIKYFYLVITGRRALDGLSTIKEANQRKNIYNEFHLFE